MSARDDVRRAAAALTERGHVLFSPLELIAEARRGGSTYPDATLRTHIVNHMCTNAPGGGAGMYPDLVRVSRGLYRLVAVGPMPASGASGGRFDAPPRPRVPQPVRARRNVDDLVASFAANLEAFARAGVFAGPSLYFHERAIERRRFASSAEELLRDERFLEYVYAVLPSWGMHRMGRQAAKVPGFEAFTESLRGCRSGIEALWGFDVTSLDAGEVSRVGKDVWTIIERLKASSSAARLVSGSKTLHHVLPDLIPPIDREYTFKFFSGQANVPAGEADAFAAWWPYLCEIGRTCRAEIGAAIARGDPMATSPSKVIDNAIVGFMQARKPPARP